MTISVTYVSVNSVCNKPNQTADVRNATTTFYRNDAGMSDVWYKLIQLTTVHISVVSNSHIANLN